MSQSIGVNKRTKRKMFPILPRKRMPPGKITNPRLPITISVILHYLSVVPGTGSVCRF
jgi:hypothetical protein